MADVADPGGAYSHTGMNRIPSIRFNDAPPRSPSARIELQLPGSPGALAPSPSTLSTSKTIYPTAVSLSRRRLANVLQATNVHSPERQPTSPFTPKSPLRAGGGFQPFERVPLPPQLAFETWWHEGKDRVHMHVTYNTATRQCLAGTSISFNSELQLANGAPVEEWDLHVGAELRLLGRKVTLRKALDLATLTWLDQQARALLTCKAKLDAELSKFRTVVPVEVQYSDIQRSERYDMQTHQHMPAGGRVNLRNLLIHVTDKAALLRQHRAPGQLPALPAAVPTAALAGPPDWSPERLMAEREQEQRIRQEAEMRQARAVQEPVRPAAGNYLEYLNSIPLAASAARGAAEAAAAAGQGKGGVGGHAGDRTRRGSISLNMDMLQARAPGASAGGAGAGPLSRVTSFAAAAAAAQSAASYRPTSRGPAPDVFYDAIAEGSEG